MTDAAIIRKNTKLYYATQLLHSLVFTIPIWIVYYQGIISAAEISYLVTFQYLAQMFLELPSGALADLIGRRKTNLIGWIFGALGFLLFPFATTFYHFLILALFIGLMDSFRSGSEEALLYDTYKQASQEDKYDRVYGNGSVIYQIGLIIGTAFGGLLYEQWIFLPYILYGFCLLVGAGLVFFFIEPRIDSETFTLKNYVNQIKNGSREAFKNSYARYLSLFYILVAGITWSGALYFNAFMMVELVGSDTLRGFLTAGMRLVNVLLIRFILQDDRFFSVRSRILFFPLIMIFAYLPGIYLEGYWGVPFVQAAMIASTARWILFSPIINKVFSSKYRATAISFLSLLIGVLYVVLTSVSAPVISVYGMPTMYTVLGIFTVITVAPVSYKLLKVSQSN